MLRLNLALAVVLVAVAPASAAAQLPVVATTTQLQDLVREVGGARVRVVGILRPNVDPHEYEPRPSDLAALAGARLVVESGAGLDAWMGRVVSGSGTRAPVLVASRAVRLRGTDPHWWHDPTNFERAAVAVGAALASVDPANRAAYAANVRRYLAQLRALDRANLAAVAAVPAGERKLVTDHDAFAYLAAHYGLTVVGTVIPSLSSAAEAGARDTARLIDLIRREHVRAIFAEASVDPKLERQIARDSGAQVVGTLYGDALGPPGSPGATYLGMERWNVEQIVAGLTGRRLPAARGGRRQSPPRR